MNSNLIASIRAKAAAKRTSKFFQFIQSMPRPIRIVDLGGSAEMWDRWGITGKHQLEITLVNNHHIDKSHLHECLRGKYIVEKQMNVMELTPSDLATFDLIFSNSMMEHLSCRSEQQQLAKNVIAAGRSFFIQVPNKYCIVDPHFPHPLAAFFAAWPRSIQARMLALHRLGSGSRSGSYTEALHRVHFYTPIGKRDMANLFPGAAIHVEKTFGLPISLVAMSSWNDCH